MDSDEMTPAQIMAYVKRSEATILSKLEELSALVTQNKAEDEEERAIPDAAKPMPDAAKPMPSTSKALSAPENNRFGGYGPPFKMLSSVKKTDMAIEQWLSNPNKVMSF